MTKSILITGSTDGIGKLVAINLTKAGHTVYLHGRSEEKLAKAISEITALGVSGTIDGFVGDLSELAQVKTMADNINAKLDKLDVIINNAGVFKAPDQSADGYDLRLAVNYLAPVMLTEKILPLLKNSATADSPARIINLSSAAQSPVYLPALLGESSIDMQASYAQSKLALTIWSFDIAKQLASDNVNVIAVNPGSLLNTRMVAEAYGNHWSSADKGGNILTELAVSDEYEGISGKYFDNDLGDKKGAFGNAHPDANNAKKANELAVVTQEILAKFV